MHYWNDGYNGWWWMIPMMLLMLAVVATVVWALVHSTRPDQPTSPSVRSPEEVLAQRLAAGEIDTAEYKARLDALREGVTRSV